MGIVEIGFTLLSFIWVIALTHILECARDLWAARDRVKPSASQILWIAGTLLLVVTSWFALPGFGEQLRGVNFLLLFVYALVMFFTAAMVSPKVPETGGLDLAAYEDREGPAYKLSLMVLLALSLLLNWRLRHQFDAGMTPASFLRSQWFLGPAAVALLASLSPRPRGLRLVAAIVYCAINGVVGLCNCTWTKRRRFRRKAGPPTIRANQA